MRLRRWQPDETARHRNELLEKVKDLEQENDRLRVDLTVEGTAANILRQELADAREALEQKGRLHRLVAGHHVDEKKAHRRTREVLADQFGVPVDTEDYDESFDIASGPRFGAKPEGTDEVG